MRRQIPRFVLVFATALLAGCVSDPFVPTHIDEDPEDAKSDAPEAPENEPTSAPAGEPAPPPEEPAPISEPGDPQPSVEESASPTKTSIDVAFEGRTAGRVCRGHPYHSSSVCVIMRPGENTTVPLERLAKPLVLQGILTWNASAPSNGHLVVQLMVHNGDQYVYSHGPWGAREVGQSPLFVSINLAKYAGQQLALAVGPDECMLDTGPVLNCALAGNGVAMIDSSQGFAFKGELIGWD